MKTILRRLWEEPALCVAVLLIVVKRVVLPLLGLDGEVAAGIEDVLILLGGLGVRGLVAPTSKLRRQGEGPHFNDEVRRMLGRR